MGEIVDAVLSKLENHGDGDAVRIGRISLLHVLDGVTHFHDSEFRTKTIMAVQSVNS